MDNGAIQGVPLFSIARPLALNPRTTAHELAPPARNASHVQLGASQQAHQLEYPARIASPVPLGATQQSHQVAPFSLAPYALASPAPSTLSALPGLWSYPSEGSQPGLLLAPLTLPFQPNSQTARPFSPNSQTARPSSPNTQITRPSSLNLQ